MACEAIEVPLSARPQINGNEELLGYLGIKSMDTLRDNYFSRGLTWDMKIGAKVYYLKANVDAWLLANTEKHREPSKHLL